MLKSKINFYNSLVIDCDSEEIDINSNQDITFEIKKIFTNQENIQDENEEEEDNKIYFVNSPNSFLGKKRKNDSSNLNPEINEVIKNKETKESTKGEAPKLKLINFIDIKKPKSKIYRNDYYIKKFKVECFSNYATKKLNKILKECNFPKNLGLTKIYMPNNKAFTSVANLKVNQNFLPMKIKDIFCLEEGNGQYQVQNRIIFDKILSHKKNAKNIKAYEIMIRYLNMTIEEIIKEYYFSEEFENFKTNLDIIEYDEAFQKEKKFSLLEDFGFLKLIQNNYAYKKS